MGIYALFVVNRSGGLIYHEKYVGAPAMSLNEALRMASTFHSVQQIAADVAPVAAVHECGMVAVEATEFRLRAYQPRTGVQFVLLSTLEVNAEVLQSLLVQLHLLYADYALKNPFYEKDMPIRCRRFEMAVARLLDGYTGRDAVVARPMRA